MRTIKFRAWDKKDKVWIQEFHLTSYGKLLVWEDENESYSKPMFDIILQQFTGLLDKNGKEIYEGDLIKHDLWGITEIVWEHGMFRGSNYENSKNKKWNELIDVTLADHQLQRCRIIGNVFENKNLLVPPKTQRYEKTNREREDGL